MNSIKYLAMKHINLFRNCCLIIIVFILAGRVQKNPLMQAAWEGRTDKLEILISQGIDVNEKGSSSCSNSTALMEAAERGHTNAGAEDQPVIQ